MARVVVLPLLASLVMGRKEYSFNLQAISDVQVDLPFHTNLDPVTYEANITLGNS